MSPHPANLWVGTDMEAQVDRLLRAVDESRGEPLPKDPGRAAQMLLGAAPAVHRDLPRGDAWEPMEDADEDGDVPPPAEVA